LRREEKESKEKINFNKKILKEIITTEKKRRTTYNDNKKKRNKENLKVLYPHTSLSYVKNKTSQKTFSLMVVLFKKGL